MVVKFLKGESPTQSASGRIKKQRQAKALRDHGIDANVINEEIVISHDPQQRNLINKDTGEIIASGSYLDLVKKKVN